MSFPPILIFLPRLNPLKILLFITLALRLVCFNLFRFGSFLEVIFSIQVNEANTITETMKIAAEAKQIILKEIPYITNLIIKLELTVSPCDKAIQKIVEKPLRK
jgi:hypothetical protein